MRTLIALMALAPALALAAPKSLSAKGQFKFLSDAPVEKIFGTADGTTAELTIDFDDLTQTKGTVKVPVGAMKTGNETRDEHLKSPQWLDAKQFPHIEFAIGSVKQVSKETKGEVTAAKLEAKGTFKLHGVSKEITVPVDVKWKGDKVKVSTKFKVALADYQIKGKEGVVGDKVGETIEVEGSLKGVAK